MKSFLAKFTFENLAAKVVLPEFLVNMGLKLGMSPAAIVKWGTWALLPWPLMIGFLVYWGFKAWKNRRELKSALGAVLPSSMKDQDTRSSESLSEKVSD